MKREGVYNELISLTRKTRSENHYIVFQSLATP